MKQFILIDQSIKDAGGHHLEYALRVLRAAKSRGFKTVLVVNKSSEDIEHADIDAVHKIFSSTFWENFNSEKKKKKKSAEGGFFNYLKGIKNDFLYSLFFGPFGIIHYLFTYGYTPKQMVEMTSGMFQTQRATALTIALAYLSERTAYFKFLVREFLKKRLSFIRKPLKLVSKLIQFLLVLVFSPVLVIVLYKKWKNTFGKRAPFVSAFSKECISLFSKIDISNDDIVFVPTLDQVELLGIAHASNKKKRLNINWHLLFRRNLFHGREPSYAGSFDTAAAFQTALYQFKEEYKGDQVYFYTDTDPLTEQYNLLGVYDFSTVPIPFDDDIDKACVNHDNPLQVSYIGDARDEKGFPLLPGLAADVLAAGYDENDVKFWAQSNFNIPGGEAASRVAKSQLDSFDSNYVEMEDGPFGSVEYTKLVNNADILLILYNDKNYYARSSGIYAEALVAGTPTLIPYRSWMANVAVRQNDTYYKSLIENEVNVLQVEEYKNGSFDDMVSIKPKSKEDIGVFVFEIELKKPSPGVFFRVSWDHDHPHIPKMDKDDIAVNTAVLDCRRDVVRCLLKVPNKYKTNFRFYCLNHELPIQSRISEFKSVKIYECADTSVSRFFGSVMYEGDVDVSSAMLELIHNYKTYEKQSQLRKNDWKKFHSSEALVEILERQEQANVG